MCSKPKFAQALAATHTNRGLIVSGYQLINHPLPSPISRIGGVFLDLLTQPVDVGFQGMGGDPEL